MEPAAGHAASSQRQNTGRKIRIHTGANTGGPAFGPLLPKADEL